MHDQRVCGRSTTGISSLADAPSVFLLTCRWGSPKLKDVNVTVVCLVQGAIGVQHSDINKQIEVQGMSFFAPQPDNGAFVSARKAVATSCTLTCAHPMRLCRYGNDARVPV